MRNIFTKYPTSVLLWSVHSPESWAGISWSRRMESVCTGLPFFRVSLNSRGVVLAVMLWIWRSFNPISKHFLLWSNSCEYFIRIHKNWNSHSLIKMNTMFNNSNQALYLYEEYSPAWQMWLCYQSDLNSQWYGDINRDEVLDWCQVEDATKPTGTCHGPFGSLSAPTREAC